jgi:hypothetical protein
MSYQELPTESYKKMFPKDQIAELKKWLEDQLNEHRAILRSVAGAIPECDPDLDTVLSVDMRDLPKMINDYEEDSLAHAILKYRIANKVEICDDSILDSDMVGEIVVKICECCDSEEDMRTLQNQRSVADSMVTLCRIFCFKDLEKSFLTWYP